MESPAKTLKTLQALHGGLLLGLLALPAFFPSLARWPWYLLVPLLIYSLLVLAIRPLRRSCLWVRLGRLNAPVLGITAAIILISSTALITYALLFHPDTRALAEQVFSCLPGSLASALMLFCTLNALLEEMVFRGVLLDALEAQTGARWAVVFQALAFGVGHAHGYPPGGLGVVMASVYGLLLGQLRLQARGLAAPFLAHIFADATIFFLVVKGIPYL